MSSSKTLELVQYFHNPVTSHDQIAGFLKIGNFAIFEQKIHELGYSFSIRNSSKLKSLPAFKHRGILRNENDRNDVPFKATKMTLYHCSKGKLYYSLKKDKPGSDYSSLAKKTRFHLQDTKKANCPATMVVYETVLFEEYVLKDDTRREKKKVLDKLKLHLLNSKGAVNSERKIYVKLGLTHNHSIASAQLTQKVDVMVTNEIKRIVFEERNTNPVFINSLIRSTLRSNGIKMGRTSRSFFPNNKTIRNYVLKYSFEKKKSKIDQETVELNVHNWSKNGKVFYRPYRTLGNKIEPFLFCYQANWQADLLEKYGDTVLLDATYKTTKYSLPLFLVVVKTNINFCPVSCFLVQHEDTKSISEALRIFYEWNKMTWNPRFFIVDYSESEINAIKTVFRSLQYLQILICLFHREQAWERWTKRSGNLDKKEVRDHILKLWRDVANSSDMVTFEHNLKKLENDSIFSNNRNTSAKKYFRDTWLSVKEMWVSAFLNSEFLFRITTNNGIEAQNKYLKYSFLKNHTDKSLSNILQVIIEEYLPTCLEEYQAANTKISGEYKRYHPEIPTFLHERPSEYIKHVYTRYKSAESVYSTEWVDVVEDGKFQVRSESVPGKYYNVDWSEPACECQDFTKYRLPCKHMCCIMILFPDAYPFESLPSAYIANPYINVNEAHSLVHEERQTYYNEESEAHNPMSQDYGNVEVVQELLPLRTSVIIPKIHLLREQAKKVIDLSYNICTDKPENEAIIVTAIECLQKCANNLEVCTKKEENLTLVPTRKNIKNSDRSKYTLLNLPRTKKMKTQEQNKGNVVVSCDEEGEGREDVSCEIITM